MASRFTPPTTTAATQRKIIQARRTAPGGKLKGAVVGTSLVATLLGWAVFAQQEAQEVTLPAAATTQAAAPAQTGTTDTSGFALPDLGSLWTALTAQDSSAGTTATSGTTTSAGQDSASTTIRTAFATTRSSR